MLEEGCGDTDVVCLHCSGWCQVRNGPWGGQFGCWILRCPSAEPGVALGALVGLRGSVLEPIKHLNGSRESPNGLNISWNVFGLISLSSSLYDKILSSAVQNQGCSEG